MTIAVGFFGSQGGFLLVGLFPAAYGGQAYDQTIDISGPATTPLVTAATVGGAAVPLGLTLDVSVDGLHARLHGTPAVPPAFNSVALPWGYQGQYYSQRIGMPGIGYGALTFTLASGSLPSWMSMLWHSDTNELEFYGTPT